MARQYSINITNQTLTGPNTVIQLKTGSTVACRLLAASIGQIGSTTSTQYVAEIVRKSTAATVTSFTPILLSSNDASSQAVSSTSGTGTHASAEGTDVDICWQDGSNILGGWDWVPGRFDIWIPPSGIIGLKVVSGTITNGYATLVFEEMP